MDCTCENCGREYEYKRNVGHTRNICNTCHSNKRRHKLKQKMVEYMGGQCVTCGYNDCYGALIFHHVNEDEKEFRIGGAECRSWKVIKKELNKCVLLCANCHHEHHHKCTELCNTQEQHFELIDRDIPDTCPVSFYSIDGRSKDLNYIKNTYRKYGSKKDYGDAIVAKNLEKNKEKVKLVLESNIDFSKFGWVNPASEIIGISPQKVRDWMKRNLPEFYKENCYERKSRLA